MVLMALTTGENCRLVAGIRNGSRTLEQTVTQGKSKQKPTGGIKEQPGD